MAWNDMNTSNGGDINYADAGILIVDDDRDTLEVLRLYLEMEGFKPTCAANGEEALVYLKSSRFYLMLTDFNMPGMDGLKLSEEAHKTAPELAIVMLTGTCLTQISNEASKLGITALLPKPYSLEKLIKIVREESERRISPLFPANLLT